MEICRSLDLARFALTMLAAKNSWRLSQAERPTRRGCGVMMRPATCDATKNQRLFFTGGFPRHKKELLPLKNVSKMCVG